MIGVYLRLYPKDGEEEAVETQMRKFASEVIRTEPGTQMYTLIRDDDGLGTMELYDDMDALRAHGATPHHDENVRVLGPKMAKAPDIKFHRVIHHPQKDT